MTSLNRHHHTTSLTYRIVLVANDMMIIKGHPADRWQLYACGGNIFGVTALVLSVLSTLRCNLIKFSSTLGTPPIDRYFGLWWYGKMSVSMDDVLFGDKNIMEEGCWRYPDIVYFDSKWMAARAFNTLALIGGFLWLMVDFCTTCAHGRIKPEPIWMGCLFLLTCLFSGLTLIALDSNICKNYELIPIENMEGYEFNDECEISTGANLVIAATVFWFVASLCSLAANKSKDDYDESARSESTEPLIREGP